MSPQLTYTELTANQIRQRRESIALLEKQLERSLAVNSPDPQTVMGWVDAIEAHQKVLADGARLIENKHVQD